MRLETDRRAPAGRPAGAKYTGGRGPGPGGRTAADPKNWAEHLMPIDLGRNGHRAGAGQSVKLTDGWWSATRVMHIVST